MSCAGSAQRRQPPLRNQCVRMFCVPGPVCLCSLFGVSFRFRFRFLLFLGFFARSGVAGGASLLVGWLNPQSRSALVAVDPFAIVFVVVAHALLCVLFSLFLCVCVCVLRGRLSVLF